MTYENIYHDDNFSGSNVNKCKKKNHTSQGIAKKKRTKPRKEICWDLITMAWSSLTGKYIYNLQHDSGMIT